MKQKNLAAEKNRPLSKRGFRNPQGLNEILSEILEHSVQGDWDRDFPSEIYIGKWKKEKVKGKTSQEWGDRLEECACSYLRKKLEKSGWRLLHKCMHRFFRPR